VLEGITKARIRLGCHSATLLKLSENDGERVQVDEALEQYYPNHLSSRWCPHRQPSIFEITTPTGCGGEPQPATTFFFSATPSDTTFLIGPGL
jgi:hypothetical protein